MAGVLDFAEYIGGADNILIEQIFPSTQRTLVYNFGQDITGWTFELDHQTLVVDPLTFNRQTGEPNFATSQVIGFFPKVEIDEEVYVQIGNAATGIVNITLPGGLYSGPILPDARSRVPITIVGVTWTTDSTPAQVNTHRIALIQCWEPDVTTGDPTSDADYQAISLGA